VCLFCQTTYNFKAPKDDDDDNDDNNNIVKNSDDGSSLLVTPMTHFNNSWITWFSVIMNFAGAGFASVTQQKQQITAVQCINPLSHNLQ